VIRLGGKHLDSEGYDLLGLMAGSEGLLGVVTELLLRLLPKPTTARALLIGFATAEDAGDCVAAVIAAGIIPGGMEMMDQPAIVLVWRRSWLGSEHCRNNTGSRSRTCSTLATAIFTR